MIRARNPPSSHQARTRKTAAWGQRAEAHSVYLADLEREEAAARELERLNLDHRAAA